MNNPNSKQPLVSIIMNCFNGEKFLKESINSITNQTYKNWELIFWDNQSQDKSAEIFKAYEDERFKYFHSDFHTTLYKARNLAIEKSKGDFIAFLDTDDLWNEKKLELQIHYFENPSVGVVYSNCWIKKKNIKAKKIYVNRKLPSGKIFDKLIDDYNVGILTAIIRKECYLKLTKKFDERFSIIGDYDLFLRLPKICLFECAQKPLATYRLHGNNLSNFNKEKEIEESEMWLKENLLNLSEFQVKKIQKVIDNRRFINYKMNKKYKECIRMLLNIKKNVFSIKNILIFFTPLVLLKKFLWFY